MTQNITKTRNDKTASELAVPYRGAVAAIRPVRHHQRGGTAPKGGGKG